MGWLHRWEMGDPAKVYEQKEAAQLKRQIRKATVDPFGAVWVNKVKVMTREESEQIEELLMRWYEWARAYRPALGAPRVSPYGRNVEPNTGDVHTDPYELDARLAAADAEVVDACLSELSWRARSAVGIHVANRAAGAEVYRNPRMSREETHQEYHRAKIDLLPMLQRRGMIQSSACTSELSSPELLCRGRVAP